MATYLDLTPPIYSPWGATQTATEELPGVWHVTTASHGGYILDHARNERVPDGARNPEGAYEEDVCWSIPACVFADEFTAAKPDYPLDQAKATLHDWMPEEYEAIFAVPANPETSYALKRRAAYAAATGKRVVIAALGGPNRDIPEGFVGVWTKTVTGLHTSGNPIYANDERRALIPADQYPPVSASPIVLDTLPWQPMPVNA
jgi:hypothetical protein